MSMRLLLLGCLLLGCADDTLAGVGQPCNSSGDCAPGLFCDFSNSKMHSCQPAGPLRDMSVPDDLAGSDSAVSD